MKIHPIFLIFLVVLFSCSKDDDNSPPVASISFSLNGTQYNWKQVDDQRSEDFLQFSIIKSYGGDHYTLHVSQPGPYSYADPKYISFRFPATTLTVNTTYTVTHDNIIYEEPAIYFYASSNVYESTAADDFGTITITKIQNDIVDGTFTARLTRRSNNAKIQVTGGQFKNVEIFQ